MDLTQTLRRLGEIKTHWCQGTPGISEQHEPPMAVWPPSSALLPCSQMTISIKTEGSQKGKVPNEKLHSVIRRQVLDCHKTAPVEQAKP